MKAFFVRTLIMFTIILTGFAICSANSLLPFNVFQPSATVKITANKVICQNGVQIQGEPLEISETLENTFTYDDYYEHYSGGDLVYTLLDSSTGQQYQGNAVINYTRLVSYMSGFWGDDDGGTPYPDQVTYHSITTQGPRVIIETGIFTHYYFDNVLGRYITKFIDFGPPGQSTAYKD